MTLPRLAFVVGWLIVTPSLAASQDLDRYLTGLHEEGQFSGSVSVTKNDEVLLSKGYGLADVEQDVANTPRTRFQIGSITKQFTAMAVLILQEQGKLRVSDTVGEYLTDVPAIWRPLTVHQLLTRTSGIMHSWALPGFAETMAVPATLDEVLRRFHDQPLLFAPGEDFQYSGVGYFLLAKLIEAVTSEPYATFLREAVLAEAVLQPE